jgi:hypothetical protein
MTSPWVPGFHVSAMFFLAPTHAVLAHTFQVAATLTVSKESRLLNLLLNFTQMY